MARPHADYVHDARRLGERLQRQVAAGGVRQQRPRLDVVQHERDVPATGRQAFAFTATITAPSFEDHTMVWDGRAKGEDHPFRVHIQPDVVRPEDAYVPALSLLPELEFPRKWPVAHWQLAFQGNVHLIPEADFARIEAALRAARPVGAAAR